MAKVFETNFENGSYVDPVTGDVFTQTGVNIMKRTEKGIAYSKQPTGFLTFDNPITMSRLSSTLVLEFKGWDEAITVQYLLYGGSGVMSRLIKNSNDLEMESNDNGSYWFDYTTSAAQRTAMQNKFHQLIVVAANGAVIAYLNGVQIDTGTPTGDITFTTLFTASTGFNFVRKLAFYDHPFSIAERIRAYNEFDKIQVTGLEKRPRQNPHNKPTDLSGEHGIVAAWNMVPSEDKLIDISGNGHDGTIAEAYSTLNGLKFSGVSASKVSFTRINLGTTYTACFHGIPGEEESWMSDGGASDYLYFKTTNTIYHKGSAGTLCIYTLPSAIDLGMKTTVVISRDGDTSYAYINGGAGIAGSNVTGAFGINLIGGHITYAYSGEIEDIRIFDYAFSLNQARNYHNSFANRVKLIENFKHEIINTEPRDWISSDQDFFIEELTTQDTVLKHLKPGTKYLERNTWNDGNIVIPSQTVIGTWEWDVREGNLGGWGAVNFVYINPLKNLGWSKEYMFTIDFTDYFIKMWRGGVTMLQTADNYIVHSTWYRIKITRTSEGVFTTYIKGGAFGSTYTLVDASVSGSNPHTDDIFWDSNFFCVISDPKLRFTNLVITEGVIL